MQRIGDRLRIAGAVALALALVPLPLAAQSANDWRLPGATVTPAPPGSQGPVDRDNPVVTTTAPRPSQSATPTPVATPSPAAPTPAATRSAAPRPAPTAARPTASPQTTVPDTSALPPATALPTLTPAATTPAPVVLPPAPSPQTVEPESGWYWPWIAGAAALLALIFAGLWWRKRQEAAVAVVAFERPVVQPRQPKPQPQPQPQPAPEPAAKPQPAPRPAPAPAPVVAVESGLGIALEARRMNASLMATSLNYVLKLTNHGSEPLSALAVEGDMISAHASLPPEAQIANDNQRMEPRHNLVTLAPGESAEFSGVFMLPLTAVTPIRSGDAAFFVPLARLRVQASTPSGGSLVQAQTWVVGELPEDAASALKPFRLDLGPRTYSRVGQRAVK
ncbi:hypothetical protein ACQKOE_08645 [Novosphingobium sp. NPDC080210]|uniref:hypothetical protein n=1 Tax=Novosphingobium sp. NPDC080210 TaxID=3390596 RepID=UPI003D0859CD